MTAQSTMSGMRAGQREVIDALDNWFRARMGAPRARIIQTKSLAGGLSNETHLVTVAVPGAPERRFVVRWDPGEGVMAPYDMALQFNVFRALHGTDVPVPEAFWLETDPAVLGRDFWAIAFVEGETVGRLLDPRDERSEKRQASFLKALTSIHAVNWRSAGLGEILGSPGETPGLAALESVEPQRHAIVSRDEAAVFERARDWLLERLPRQWTISLVHGDCSLSNYLFLGTEIAAVLDWELAALSDPLQDVGYYCNLIYRYRDRCTPEQQGRERAAFLDAYQAATGCSFDDLSYWEALAAYRNGVLSRHPLYAPHATDHYKNRLIALTAR